MAESSSVNFGRLKHGRGVVRSTCAPSFFTSCMWCLRVFSSCVGFVFGHVVYVSSVLVFYCLFY